MLSTDVSVTVSFNLIKVESKPTFSHALILLLTYVLLAPSSPTKIAAK